jgi:hypothetical protein
MYPRYTDLVREVRETGWATQSRFGDTSEMMGQTLGLAAGEVVRRPNFNPQLAWMEAVQTIAGKFDAGAIAEVAPRAPHFFTPDIAYGPRLAEQLPKAIDKLARNPLDRQAVLHIGVPGDQDGDFPPCAQTMQFLLRHGQLGSFVYWRSWDMVMGLPYDVWNFQVLASAVAACLSVRPGPQVHAAGSLHYYAKNERFLPVTDESRKVGVSMELFGSHEQNWRTLVYWAETMVDPARWVMSGVKAAEQKPLRPQNTFQTEWGKC